MGFSSFFQSCTHLSMLHNSSDLLNYSLIVQDLTVNCNLYTHTVAFLQSIVKLCQRLC